MLYLLEGICRLQITIYTRILVVLHFPTSFFFKASIKKEKKSRAQKVSKTQKKICTRYPRSTDLGIGNLNYFL